MVLSITVVSIRFGVVETVGFSDVVWCRVVVLGASVFTACVVFWLEWVGGAMETDTRVDGSGFISRVVGIIVVRSVLPSTWTAGRFGIFSMTIGEFVSGRL